MLDAGFGDGQHLFGAARKFPKLNFWGVDKMPEHIRFAVTYFAKYTKTPAPRLLHTTIEAMNFHNQFDLVLCSATLQYIKDDLGALQCLLNALKPSGTLLLYVPVTNRSLLPWFKHLQRHLSHYDQKQQKKHFYSLDALREKCQRAGFHILAAHKANGWAGILANEWYNTWLMLAGNAGWWSWLLMPIALPLVLPVLPLQWLDDLLPKEKANGVLLVLQKPHRPHSV